MSWFTGAPEDSLRVTFMCVENAGRSQMAAAFAERERDGRGLTDRIEIASAGTRPADEIHPIVVEAMSERGIDISDRTPLLVELEELKTVDNLVTMGCYIAEFRSGAFGIDSREWSIANPEGEPIETVREIADDLEQKVANLFDEIEEKLE